MSIKSELKALLIKDEVDRVFESLLSFLPDNSDEFGEVVIQSSRWEELKSDRRTEQAEDKEIRREKNNLIADLLSFINELPDEVSYKEEENEELVKPKEKGITETRFKWIVFIGIVVVKGIVFILLTETGGFLSVQKSSIQGILWPVFATSLILMFKHIWDNWGNKKDSRENDSVNVSYGRILFVILILLGYFISMIIAIRQFQTQYSDFPALLTWVNYTEASFGAAIGYIVTTLFKSDD